MKPEIFVSLDIAPDIRKKRNKGKSLLEFPEEYVVIDIETTGCTPSFDDIIEVAAIKVVDCKVTDNLSSLIRPSCRVKSGDKPWKYVDSFITSLTGITNDMLESAPVFSEKANEFLEFIGDSVLVGHNVHFDINFIYDELLEAKGIELKNDFCDLYRISRRLFPDLENHRLSTLCLKFNIKQTEAHRALSDCYSAFKCFECCREYAKQNSISFEPYTRHGLDLTKLHSTTYDFDISHPLYNKVCVFTGALDKMKRVDAAQIVLNFGGVCENTITKRTNFLIMGNTDYCRNVKGGKTSKMKRAEELILKGHDLKIITEDDFYDMSSDNA